MDLIFVIFESISEIKQYVKQKYYTLLKNIKANKHSHEVFKYLG